MTIKPDNEHILKRGLFFDKKKQIMLLAQVQSNLNRSSVNQVSTSGGSRICQRGGRPWRARGAQA